MWNGKMKAVTFSLDDGVTQDIRAIEILNKYGLKATFNINSELLGQENSLTICEKKVPHNKVFPEQVKSIYAGHEVAVHTLTHPRLTTLDEQEIIRQVEQDRKNLSELCGYEVIGMAYPCGGVNNDERVAKIIKENTGVKFSRTITANYQFDKQSYLYRFNPTIHFIDESIDYVIDRFLEDKAETPQLFYIWGHAYEMDCDLFSWERFEKICQKLSNKEGVFYGTNRQVLLGE